MAFILASKSPRRRELLQQIGLTEFEIRPAQGEETRDPALSPAQLVEQLSLQKAHEVAALCSPEDTILAADTIVVLDDVILGKPADAEDARRMLTALSGRQHQVLSGVTVQRGGTVLTAHEVTQVFFRPMTQEEINWYISTGEPMDKAGAYGIQGLAARFIPRIEGDYSNVVGLPLCLLTRLLAAL